jgi:hypothetical protein
LETAETSEGGRTRGIEKDRRTGGMGRRREGHKTIMGAGEMYGIKCGMRVVEGEGVGQEEDREERDIHKKALSVTA